MLRLEHVCVRWSLSVCVGCVCVCVCVRERERERERETHRPMLVNTSFSHMHC